MIINGQIITPDLWEEIKDLEIIEAIDYLYHKGFFGEDIPLVDENGTPYNSIFQTGINVNFELVNLFDYQDQIRQLELLMRLKHKYNRPYNKQMTQLKDIYKQLKVLNVLHK